MECAYEAYRRDGSLPATYEVIYGASWGAVPGSRTLGAETVIDVNSIRRTGRP
jgi:hypothetical protein